MSEALQKALASLTSAIDSGGEVTGADLDAWQAALTAALERIDRLEQTARASLDAYLLRAAPSASRVPPSARAAASIRKQHMQRLAAAMAALEKELDADS
ncbi:MAG: hypothetical protein JXA97_01880 [Anaerolineales bacterium]|nr:hypothetical protein [Anaerolineales bacterium]